MDDLTVMKNFCKCQSQNMMGWNWMENIYAINALKVTFIVLLSNILLGQMTVYEEL